MVSNSNFELNEFFFSTSIEKGITIKHFDFGMLLHQELPYIELNRMKKKKKNKK